ncbi:helix-turn-helix domain-containing protein [Streptosporangium saharense]|uniref:Transcriptional regulator with XRE-family HTH domain n=1 Tax=Streptosporangium saharense TaxID=1706840 RepID=A0A7W7VKC3_9ACTN|nr:helix-turn-helix transcriptional regulator [Streptosporangium saharense]MBB4913408.1 transcriptional regulator with XRE-family HTH domain [Streptosporangium saharense]
MKHSTVRLRRLSRELRTLRAATEMTTEAAAEQLGWSRSKLNRFETGKGAPTTADVAAICHLYCVAESTTEALVQLTREVARRGWWTAYSDVFTGSYVEFEAAAKEILHWAPLLVPGLLQTEEYAREIIQAGHPDRSDVELSRRIDARMQRKTSLLGAHPVVLHIVIAEYVLRYPVGTPDVMARQLDEILQAIKQPNITIQVLPMAAGVHGGTEGAFSVLTFGDEDPDLGYAECPAGEVYVEDLGQIQQLKLNFKRLAATALSPEDSAAFVAAVRSEYD